MAWLGCHTLFLWSLVAILEVSAGVEDPVVTIKSGQLRGSIIKSFVGNDVLSFKGIPYAEPPLDELRFRPPRPHGGWSGVREAKEHGSKCLQVDLFTQTIVEGAEDCLFLNVYTPRLPSPTAPANLPVMVWIHGGGFFFGSGDADFYGPEFLEDEQVVLVTINYRLNVFGFMTTGDAAAPGNYGLHDQVLALQWVRDNIAAFGGDHQLVTIFGESAGGASVGLQVLSPRAAGMFSRAISQSGASFCSFAASGAPQGEIARKQAELLGCDTSSSQASVECMRQQPAEKLMETLSEVSPKVYLPIAYKPRVDADSESPFLPEDPHSALKAGRFNRVPWINGMTAHEGGFSINMLTMTGKADLLLGQDWDIWSKSLLEIDGVTDDPAATSEEIYRFYLGDASGSSQNDYPKLSEIFTDRMFSVCVTKEAELASPHTPVFQYVLDHMGPGRQNVADIFNQMSGVKDGPDLGVTHAEDLLYLFQPVFAPRIQPDSAEHKMVRFMVSLWVIFARYGVPSTGVLAMPTWPTYSTAEKQHMRLNLSPSVGTDAFGDRVRFWQQLDIRENWRTPHQRDRKDEL